MRGRERLEEFLRYGVVGVSSTVIDFGTLALLTDVGSWHPLCANPVAFVLGVTNGFYWNRHWTFAQARHEAPMGQYARFVLVNLVGILLDQSLLAAALVLGPGAGLSPEEAKWVGKILSIPFVVAWNFTANVRWTFRPRSERPVLGVTERHEEIS